MKEVAAAHPEARRIELWWQDEARVGQKGRETQPGFERGQRPPGRRDDGFASVWRFGAVCPERATGAARALPEASTQAMNLFLMEPSQAVAPDAYARVVRDKAGWHTARGLAIPANLTPLFLPPRSPDLTPAERVWEHLRENRLSHRVFGSVEAIIDACCDAWNTPLAEVGRIRSLRSFPWIEQVRTS